MRFVKVAAAATSLLVLGAVTSFGPAEAAATGVGTSKVSTSVLHASLGGGTLLDLKLLTDSAQSTIDAKTAAAPEAFSKLTALTATSNVFTNPLTSQPLNLSLEVLESRQPGGQASVERTSVDLANPGVPVPVGLGSIVSGSLNLAKLTSEAGTASAKSTLDGSLANVSVAGGVLNAQSLASGLTSTSGASESGSTRGVDVGAITVLDLGAVLDGLNILLTDLTPSQVSDLLESLDVPIPGLDPAATLSDTIDEINDKIDELQDALNGGTATLIGDTGALVDDLGLGGVVPDSVTDTLDGVAVVGDQVNQLVDTLQGAIASVSAAALSALDAAPLLKLDGIDVSVVTKAVDTEAASVADVTGTIGAITIGNIGLPAIDLAATAEAVNTAVATINDTLSDTLGVISVPVTGGTLDLSDLVSVELLKKTKSISKVGDYVTATAGFTGLTATINPPDALDVLVQAISDQTTVAGQSIGAAILAAGLPLPALSDAMGELETLLGGVAATTGALSDGGTVNVVEVMGVSEFRAIAATTTTGGPGSLPATGNSQAQLAAVGLLLVALGLGLGRWFNMPVPAWVRRRF